MIVYTEVLDESAQVSFQGHTEINGLMLTVVAESREDLVRKKGPEFAQGAIPFFGSQLVEALKSRKSDTALKEAIVDMTMATWLYEFVFCGMTPEQFVASDLIFTINHIGAVGFKRLPAVHS